MRKHNDLIVIFTDATKAKEYAAVTLDEAKSLPPKSIKMMYSFKRLVIVGNFLKIQKEVLELTKMASITSVHIV